MEIKKNRIILRKRNNCDGFYLFRSAKSELLCREIHGGRLDGRETVLHGAFQSGFDALIDESDNLHIVFSDYPGNIVYIGNSGGKWSKGIFLNAKEGAEVSPDSFYIFRHGAAVSVLYTVRHENRVILCMQRAAAGIEKPEAVCGLSPDYCDIFAASDSDGNISVFYNEKETGLFGKKDYIPTERKWSEFRSFPSKIRHVGQAFPIFAEGALLCACKSDDEIRLIRTYADGGAKEKILSKRHTRGCTQPILRHDGERLRIMWGHGKRIFSSSTHQGFDGWQKMSETFIAAAPEISVFKLCCAQNEVPGYCLGYINGAELKLYTETPFFTRHSGDAAAFSSEHSEKTAERSAVQDTDTVKKEGDSDFTAQDPVKSAEYSGFTAQAADMVKNRAYSDFRSESINQPRYGTGAYSKEKIDEVKEKIMEQMGIKHGNDSFEIPDTARFKSFDTDTQEPAPKEKISEKPSGRSMPESLSAELQSINDTLSGMRTELERMKALFILFGTQNRAKKKKTVRKKRQ